MASTSVQDGKFSQSGQIDWVYFAKTVTNMPVDITMRFQGAGVQHDRGLAKVEEEVRKHHVYWTVSKLIYLGFGHWSLFAHLSEAVDGLKVIALCSSLSELHSDSVTARILAALFKQTGCPESYQPSHAQFLGLVKACSGALAASVFSEVVSRMLEPIRPWVSDSMSSDPTDIDKALQALFDISTGLNKSIFVVGGQSVAFIAAAAYWLFSLNTYVEDRNGQTIFSSSADSSSCQVHIKYSTDMDSKHVIVMQKTYKVGSFRDLFVADEVGTLRQRCPWISCLSLAFGKEFQNFMEPKTSVGSMLGCVAHIYQAQHEGDGELDVRDRKLFLNYTESSYGRGFLNTVTETFQELSSTALSEAMEASLKRSLRDAEMALEGHIHDFEKHCGCRSCSGNGRTEDYGCYLGLAATLVDLISTMSAVNIEHEDRIQPTLGGLRYFLSINTTKIHEKGAESSRSNRPLYRRRRSEKYNGLDPTKRLELILENVL